MVNAPIIPAGEQTGPDPAIARPPAPPPDASNHPDDINAGVATEASPELLAAIAASHLEQPLPMEGASGATGPAAPVVDPGGASGATGAEPFDAKDILGDEALEGDGELAKMLAGDSTPAWLRQTIKVERQKRRDAVKAQQAADDRAALLQRDLEAARAAPPAPEPPRPTRDQFDNPEAYDAAIDAWTTAKTERAVAQARADEARERQTQDRQAAEQRQTESILATQRVWTGKRDAAIKAHPDYEAVAESDNVRISPPMAMAIMNAENGTEIAYHLGKNIAEAAAIATMGPLQQVIEIGRLSARLAQAGQPEVSRAAAPIEPLSGNRASVTQPVREPTMEEVAAKARADAAKERTPMWGGKPH